MTRWHDASAWRTWAIWVVVLVIAIAVPFGSFDPFSLFRPQVVRSQQGDPSTWQLSCRVILDFLNQKRRVTGAIDAECPGVTLHSAPFGNWGVNSNYGWLRDENEFAGWERDSDGTRHWNSCTIQKWRYKFPTGGPHPYPYTYSHPYYYNDPIPARTRQKADPDDARTYAATIWQMGHPFEPDMSCQDVLPPLFVFSGLFMDLHELDLGDDDEHTETLGYPDVHVPITCQSAWNCTGESAWTSQNSSHDRATADIRVTLETRRLQ